MQHAVFARDFFGEDLVAVANQQTDARLRFSRSQILSEHKQLVAQRFRDDVDVADDQHRGRFEFLAGYCDSGYARPIDGDFNLVFRFAVLLEADDFVIPILVGIDQRDVQSLDA